MRLVKFVQWATVVIFALAAQEGIPPTAKLKWDLPTGATSGWTDVLGQPTTLAGFDIEATDSESPPNVNVVRVAGTMNEADIAGAINGLGAGPYSFRVRAVDVAGLMSSWEGPVKAGPRKPENARIVLQVTVDTTKP